MRLSNLPPGITDRMLPGYDDDSDVPEMPDYCDGCGRSEGHRGDCPNEHPEMGCDLCGTPVSDGSGHYSETSVGTVRLCWSCFGM